MGVNYARKSFMKLALGVDFISILGVIFTAISVLPYVLPQVVLLGV
jgi:hypothetical protein